MNVITIDSLNGVLTFIKDYGLKGDENIEIKYEIISVNVSRLKSVKEDSYFQALNQIYIVKIIKTVKPSNKPSNTDRKISGRGRALTFKIEQGQSAYQPNVKIRNKAIKVDSVKDNGENKGSIDNIDNAQND